MSSAKDKISYVFWTCKSKEEAKKVIHALLSKKLIACASLIPHVESIYVWKGQVEESEEVKVILKTLERHFEAIRETILEQGSYEVPEIVLLDISQGNPAYLDWVAKSCLD